MKTIRTIIATLSAVLLTFALVAWFSVRRSAAFIQRTIYQGFDQTFVVALVMGCAFLLIAIILSVAIASTDDEEDEEEEESFQPRHQTRPVAVRSEEPYRRVSRSVEQGRLAEQSRSRREAEDEFARPRPRTEPKPQRRKGEEPPAQRKRERVADRPDQVAVSRREPPVKKEKKAPRPQEDGFIRTLCQVVREAGYRPVLSVGHSGCRVEIGVEDPGRPGWFLAGIETDGRTYQQARTARDRECLRPEMLRSMGWNYIRVWSTQWLRDPESERKKLLSWLRQAADKAAEAWGQGAPGL